MAMTLKGAVDDCTPGRRYMGMELIVLLVNTRGNAAMRIWTTSPHETVLRSLALTSPSPAMGVRRA